MFTLTARASASDYMMSFSAEGAFGDAASELALCRVIAKQLCLADASRVTLEADLIDVVVLVDGRVFAVEGMVHGDAA